MAHHHVAWHGTPGRLNAGPENWSSEKGKLKDSLKAEKLDWISKKTVCSTELTIQFCDVSWPFYLLNWWETSISTERLEKTGYPKNLESPAEMTKQRNDLGVSMGFFVNGRLDSKGAIEGGVLVFFVEMNWVDVGWKVLILGDVRIHHCNQNVPDFSMKTTCFFKPSKLELCFMRERKEHWEWK